MEKIKLNEEQIEEYVDIITNFQHILNDILNSVENGEIDEMQLSIIEEIKNSKLLKSMKKQLFLTAKKKLKLLHY